MQKNYSFLLIELLKEVNIWINKQKKFYKIFITLFRREFDHKLKITFINSKISTLKFVHMLNYKNR